MPKESEYRGQRILIHKPGDISFFLFNGDGDVDEFPAKSEAEARKKIEAFYMNHNGFYNGDGELYQE